MKQFHGFGLLNEMLRFFTDLETEPLFEADGPKDARGIFHKTEAVEDADDFILEVPSASEKVQEFAGCSV